MNQLQCGFSQDYYYIPHRNTIPLQSSQKYNNVSFPLVLQPLQLRFYSEADGCKYYYLKGIFHN